MQTLRSLDALPEGVEVAASAIQRSEEGELEAFFLLERGSTNVTIAETGEDRVMRDFVLLPSGRTFQLTEPVTYEIGPTAGSFIAHGGDAEGRELIVTPNETLVLPPDSIVALSSNGVDYAYLRRDEDRNRRPLFWNGIEIDEVSSLRSLALSPDGTRLAFVRYYATRSEYERYLVRSYDLSDPDNPRLEERPDGDLEIPFRFLAFDSRVRDAFLVFDDNNELYLHYGYGGNRESAATVAIRSEHSFVGCEFPVDELGEYTPFMRSLSVFHRYQNRLFLNGDEIESTHRFIDYELSDNFDGLMSVGLTEPVRSQNPSSRDLAWGVTYDMDIVVQSEGRTLVRESVETNRPQSLFGWRSRPEPHVTVDDLRFSGFDYRVHFSHDATPLVALSIHGGDELRTIVTRNGRRVRGFRDFRTFFNGSDFHEDIYLLIDEENFAHLVVDHHIVAGPYDLVYAVAPSSDGGIAILAQVDGELQLLRSFGDDDIGLSAVSATERYASLISEHPGLVVNDEQRDNDGVYLATNRGVFLSFDAGVSWERHAGFERAAAAPEYHIAAIAFDGALGYASDGQSLWFTDNGGAYWVPLEEPRETGSLVFREDAVLAGARGGVYRLSHDNPFEVVEIPLGRYVGAPSDLRTARFFDSGMREFLFLDESIMVERRASSLDTLSLAGDPRLDRILDAASGDESLFLATTGGLVVLEDGVQSTVHDSSRGLSSSCVQNVVVDGERIATLNCGAYVFYTEHDFPVFNYSFRMSRFSFMTTRTDYHQESRREDLEPGLVFERGEPLDTSNSLFPGGAFRVQNSQIGLSFSRDGGDSWTAIPIEAAVGETNERYPRMELWEAQGVLYLRYERSFMTSPDWGATWAEWTLPSYEHVYRFERIEEVAGATYLFGVSEINRRPIAFRRDSADEPWELATITAAGHYVGRNAVDIDADDEHVFARSEDGRRFTYSKAHRVWLPDNRRR